MVIPESGDILVGKYRVERVLGRGGMGIVVSARHLQLDDRVAIKLLTASASDMPDLAKRFLLEARASRRIKSEHGVRVTDIGTLETGEPFMVMEHLEGTDLSRLRRAQGTLDIEVAVEYVLQALEALAEAHTQGIIHRDLKPANLFLTMRADGSPLVKVLDFGISKVIGSSWRGGDGQVTQAGAVLGSPDYMAPEQIVSAHEIDARVDIWALGVVLYNLLTGALPFKAASVTETFVLILHSDPTPASVIRPDLPQELDAVILRCLQKSPDGRFPNVFALAAALGPFAAPRARASVDRIARVLGVPVVRSTSEEVPVARSSRCSIDPPQFVKTRDERFLRGQQSQSPNTLIGAGMSQTIRRLRSTARAARVKGFVAISGAASVGMILFIAFARWPSNSQASARASTEIATGALRAATLLGRNAVAPIPLLPSPTEVVSAGASSHENDVDEIAAVTIELPERGAGSGDGALTPVGSSTPEVKRTRGRERGRHGESEPMPRMPSGKSRASLPGDR